VDIIKLVAEVGGTLGLAVFAIWMLRDQMQRRVDDQKARTAEEKTRIEEERTARAVERVELVRVIERNSELWERATSTMVEICAVVTIVSTSVRSNEESVQSIREMLAARPCILRDGSVLPYDLSSGPESRVREAGTSPPPASSSDSAPRGARA